MTLESKSLMTTKGTTVREPWTGGSDNFLQGFSWPPRSYSCSFCHREFRSAQALGGHMNVHRRDRARLRVQSSSSDHHPATNNSSSSNFLNLSTNPNPNHPTFSSPPSSPSSSKSTFTLLPPPPSATDYSAASTKDNIDKRQRVDNSSSCGGYSCKVVKNKGSDQIVGLDLEIGLHLGASHDQDSNLDLELRLGCS